MKSYTQKFPLAKIGLFAIPLIACTVTMGMFFPSLKVEGYGSFIIALEFVENPEQINQLLTLLSVDAIKAIDTGHYIDFVFMLVYCGMLFFFWKENFTVRGAQTLRFGYLLVACAFLGDLMENIQLLNITSLFGGSSDYQPYLERLQIFTWVKWEAIAIVFAGISTVLFTRGIYSKVFGGLFMVPFLLSLSAFNGEPQQVAWFTTSIFLAFTLLTVYCVSYKPSNT